MQPMNVSGGMASSTSLAQLTDWCNHRFGAHQIESSEVERPFDVPWLVLDSSRTEKLWNWRPEITRDQILEEIARHAETNPAWLELSNDS